LGHKTELIDWAESWTYNSTKCMALFRPEGATAAAAG
jgi:hypothetical protein